MILAFCRAGGEGAASAPAATTRESRGYPIIAHTQRLVRTSVAVVSPRVAREILVSRQQPFHVDNFRVTLAFGYGVHPSRVGDYEHHQHAMTTPGLSFSAEPLAHYRVPPAPEIHHAPELNAE